MPFFAHKLPAGLKGYYTSNVVTMTVVIRLTWLHAAHVAWKQAIMDLRILRFYSLAVHFMSRFPKFDV